MKLLTFGKICLLTFLLMNFINANIAADEAVKLAQNEVKLFLERYRSVLQSKQKFYCKYTVAKNSTQYSNEVFGDIGERKYRRISHTLANETLITKSLFLHSTIQVYKMIRVNKRFSVIEQFRLIV
jgi:hypothetical protein